MLNDDLDYAVELPSFAGPLDLLLRLIEREELDITTIALAQVADTYLAHVRALEQPEPAAVSAFLVIAARLLLIKSRALLPRPDPPPPADALDEGEELARQLREYARFKQAAQLLQQWQAEGRRSFLRTAAPPLPTFPPKPARLDSTLADLIAAFERRMQLLLPLDPAEVPLPAPKIITVPEMAARIRARLAEQAWFGFEDLLSAATTRVEVIVAFWAVLELLKRGVITVDQPDLFAPIMLGRGPNQHDAPLLEVETLEAS